MKNISIDFAKQNGIIKPMNAVNNGPVPISVRESYSNFEDYKAARIPYARNHDASFNSEYNGEHIVDVHRIFKNFDADENDPASYVFEPTDKYLKNTIDAGTKVFYRLGASIEHNYKYGTYPPKDYLKWARICEHIIRHYTEGWADGFYYDIEYWEIWNEPDCGNPDGSNPCWQGTYDEFIEFYCTTAKYLKSCFPNKKIGGPAFCSVWSYHKTPFLERVAKENIPLDFLSYHWYGKKLEQLVETIDYARKLLDDYGLNNTETILNEWNYIKGWRGDEWKYSIMVEKNIKGASFVAGAMCTAQGLPLDMLMYYDARPCTMNGMFAWETYQPLKSYYSIYSWSDLAELGNYVDCGYKNEDIYYCAATNNSESAILLTYFDDDEKQQQETVTLDIKALSDNTNAEIYLLDDQNNLELVDKKSFSSKEFSLELNIKLYSSVLIKLTEN